MVNEGKNYYSLLNLYYNIFIYLIYVNIKIICKKRIHMIFCFFACFLSNKYYRLGANKKNKNRCLLNMRKLGFMSEFINRWLSVFRDHLPALKSLTKDGVMQQKTRSPLFYRFYTVVRYNELLYTTYNEIRVGGGLVKYLSALYFLVDFFYKKFWNI